MGKLQKMLEARKLLKECGEYDTAIAGAIAEVYAEEVLSMEKAPRGARGYDGFIDGRRVQVKGKERLRSNESASYVAISLNSAGLAEDLLVVYFDYDDQLRHIGPVEIDLIVNSKPNARETRYSVRNVRAAWDLSRRSI
jgi:hypothetical protein